MPRPLARPTFPRFEHFSRERSVEMVSEMAPDRAYRDPVLVGNLLPRRRGEQRLVDFSAVRVRADATHGSHIVHSNLTAKRTRNASPQPTLHARPRSDPRYLVQFHQG